MEFLQVLDGISPWWWVAFALALGALEMATFTLFLIWPALAALVVAGLLAASPDLSASAQITIFALVSILATFIGRYFYVRYGDGGGEENEILNKRGARFVGRTAKVLEYANGEGVVEIEGMRWRANWGADGTSEVGTDVRITKSDALVLTVEPMVS